HQLRQGAATREGPASRHAARLGDERRVLAAYPWRTAAARRSRLVGELVGEMAEGNQRSRPHAGLLLPDALLRAWRIARGPGQETLHGAWLQEHHPLSNR